MAETKTKDSSYTLMLLTTLSSVTGAIRTIVYTPNAGIVSIDESYVVSGTFEYRRLVTPTRMAIGYNTASAAGQGIIYKTSGPTTVQGVFASGANIFQNDETPATARDVTSFFERQSS